VPEQGRRLSVPGGYGPRHLPYGGRVEQRPSTACLPLRSPAGAQVLTGVRWGLLHISTFYQQVIANQKEKP
jgi:hypothetical protein